ncbi:hypothetical protein GALMADRAFT_144065 [Galerina marginata CBS 339.88]|uniref:F-box domain-containing protein n=1 Tax=Galerina marginata (strain CBS 339.88) TaxID=685588 RepID=A0A067SKB5_GALM3|nr:hypothetical protein GALMADRAFT_144065 [Galerina marginata CBS 339.88]
MALPGTNLTLDELLTALQWKLENGDDAGARNTIGIEDYSHSQYDGKSVLKRIPEPQRLTRLLEHCLNSLRPVNKLPFEILGQIFLFVQSESANTSFIRSFILPRVEPDLDCANAWIKVTHICQHWRRVAHNTKSLWRRITIDGVSPFPTYLANLSFTLSHPLSISFEHQFRAPSENDLQEIENFYTLLLDHPNRVSALYLRLSGDVPEIARHLTRQTFPNIVEFELSFEEPDRDLNNEVDHHWDKRLLGSNGDLEGILGGQAASLRKLSLTNYTWPNVVFPALTHLYLKDEFYDPEDGDLGQKFLEILASLSSSLQVLCFHGTRSPDRNSYTILPVSARPVMRVLRYLEILDAEASHGSILPLYNLSLPAIETLIWDPQWRSELYLVPPPDEYFERVTCLAGCGKSRGWQSAFVMIGKTHFFYPGLVTSNAWPIWQTLLPKIETLALDWDQRRPDDLISLLRRFSALRFLHLNMSKNVLLVIAFLEKREGDSNSYFLRRLQRLNIYVENDDFYGEQQKVSDRLFQKGLPRLDCTADNSMSRTRHHLRRKYTLRFERGHINQLCYRDIAE